MPASRRLPGCPLAAAFAAITLAGCATMLPSLGDAERAAASRGPGSIEIVGADGALMGERRRMIDERLAAYRGASAGIERKLAITSAYTGAPLTVGNRTRILVDGPAAYRAIFDAIESARDHVHIESFIFEELDFDRRLSEILVRKARHGVDVRVIYDSVGSISTPSAFLRALDAGGVARCEYNPINPIRARLAFVHHRDHRKIVVVDGLVAFTGGINFHSVYRSGSGPMAARRPGGVDEGWRDTHLRIEGPAVRELQALFLDTWKKQNCGDRPPRDHYPRAAESGEGIVSVVGSTPDGRLSPMYLTLITAITYAERNIFLTAAYFIPDPNTIMALKAAATRGVDVRLLLPGFTDSWLAFHAGRSHYDDLLSSGVRIFEYHGGLLHAKTAVVDGVWSTVGSSNVDWRSFCYNDEVNAIVVGRAFGSDLDAIFRADLGQATEITRDEWARRGPTARARESLARRFEELL
jgi:cardiolipin synthase